MRKRLVRLAACAVVFAATFWYGVNFGPSSNVRADIYMNLASAIPDLAGNRDAERNGHTLLNTNKMYYRISHSTKRPREILDEAEATFTPKEFHLFGKQALPNPEEFARLTPQLPMLEALMHRKRVVREESPGWGMVSYFDMGPEANLDWHRVFKQKMEAMAKSGRLGDMGIAKTVIVVPNPVGAATTVLSYWTDPDFNLRHFEDSGQGDLPGRDIDGFPRLSQTRRLITFDQFEGGMSFLMVMYETPLTAEQALSGYAQEAERAGWKTRRPPGDETSGAGSAQVAGPALFLQRGNEQVEIGANPNGNKTNLLLNRRIVH